VSPRKKADTDRTIGKKMLQQQQQHPPPIQIDLYERLIQLGFMGEGCSKAYKELKAALVFRMLLFIDSLHDFTNKGRINPPDRFEVNNVVTVTTDGVSSQAVIKKIHDTFDASGATIERHYGIIYVGDKDNVNDLNTIKELTDTFIIADPEQGEKKLCLDTIYVDGLDVEQLVKGKLVFDQSSALAFGELKRQEVDIDVNSVYNCLKEQLIKDLIYILQAETKDSVAYVAANNAAMLVTPPENIDQDDFSILLISNFLKAENSTESNGIDFLKNDPSDPTTMSGYKCTAINDTIYYLVKNTRVDSARCTRAPQRANNDHWRFCIRDTDNKIYPQLYKSGNVNLYKTAPTKFIESEDSPDIPTLFSPKAQCNNYIFIIIWILTQIKSNNSKLENISASVLEIYFNKLLSILDIVKYIPSLKLDGQEKITNEMNEILKVICVRMRERKKRMSDDSQMSDDSRCKFDGTENTLGDFSPGWKPDIIALYIDAQSKNRSVRYITETLIKLFKKEDDRSNLLLMKTPASIYDSAQGGNLEKILEEMQPSSQGHNYTKVVKKTPHYEIWCGKLPLIKLNYEWGESNNPIVNITYWFEAEDRTDWKGSKKYSNLNTAYHMFHNNNRDNCSDKFKYLLFKSISDFGQILYFNNNGSLSDRDFGADALMSLAGQNTGTTLRIFHTIDTWCAGIASLFGNMVICENPSDKLQLSDGNTPYINFNNTFYVNSTEYKLLTAADDSMVAEATSGGATSAPADDSMVAEATSAPAPVKKLKTKDGGGYAKTTKRKSKRNHRNKTLKKRPKTNKKCHSLKSKLRIKKRSLKNRASKTR
jgi:hypothetical protein